MRLYHALRVTAQRIRSTTAYQWGHFGACNCGHLAQTITQRNKADIHRAATVRVATWAQPATLERSESLSLQMPHAKRAGVRGSGQRTVPTKWVRYPVDDWADATVAYCPTSGLPLDDIITEMLNAGLTLSEIRHLERLSDPRILAALPHPRHLRRNNPADVALYLETWADLIATTAPPLAAE